MHENHRNCRKKTTNDLFRVRNMASVVVVQQPTAWKTVDFLQCIWDMRRRRHECTIPNACTGPTSAEREKVNNKVRFADFTETRDTFRDKRRREVEQTGTERGIEEKTTQIDKRQNFLAR